jgi:HPt (histidine-containing phosphotransfer) domain-containing protein
MGKVERVHFDIATALTRIGGDKSLFRELTGIFAEECPKLLAEFADSIEREDYDTLVRAAHTLKGRAAFFGAETLEHLAMRLESMTRARELTMIQNTCDAIAIEVNQLRSTLVTALSESS